MIDVSQARPIQEERQRFKSEKDKLTATFLTRLNVNQFLKGICKATDNVVKALWSNAAIESACLVAVGGYGRQEQFPHSDVDLLVLVPKVTSELSDRERQQLEAFLGNCWDVGLEIGHSVRTVDECLLEAAGDITIQTALLESRWLAGNRGLHKTFAEAMRQTLLSDKDRGKFFQAKLLELQQRHAKFEDTPYSLEPNCKESPGGLRDLQVLLWIAKASGWGHTWSALAERGILTEQEAKELRANERILKRIRALSHIAAKRREDRLVFDLQAQVAQLYGLAVQGGTSHGPRRASELLMQRYYRAAKVVTQLNAIALQYMEEKLFEQKGFVSEPIDKYFQNHRGLLEVREPGLFEKHPEQILRAFLVVEQHPEVSNIGGATLRQIWASRSLINAQFRKEKAHQALFMEILKAPRGITHALRRMNQWSVLGRYLPGFRKIVGQMQHDLFHVYTVDQHILMVVRNLRRFTMSEHAHEYPFCTQLMAEFNKPWLLYTAALFHDIAKGRGGDHSKLGMTDAHQFAVKHGFKKSERELVVFLVEHHLSMSAVAQKQDLSDPEVIERFAKSVGTVERLTALYLLTVADVRGTSPKVWNGWKAKLLEDLYRLAKRHLIGEAPASGAYVDEKRNEARRLLNLYALDASHYENLWAQLDIGFFLRNDPQDVAWQTRVLWRQPHPKSPIVKTRLSPTGEGFQVVVYVLDQTDLFARICGYFDSKNFSVLDAKIHTTKLGYALDSFVVIDPLQRNKSSNDVGGGHYRDILNLVESELTERLGKIADLKPPVKGRISRRSKYFPIQPKVELRPDEKGKLHLLTVTANDRTGLLYGVARILSLNAINLHAAKITTLGDRVEDLFLIDGPGLANPRDQLKLEGELLEALA
jgi:[protein-PII] uridylyltransferase